MTPETKLKALFATARPAARDHAFEARVAEKVARRRAWATVGALAPWAVAATAALWGLQPIVGPLAASLGPVMEPAGLTLAGTAITAAVSLWLSCRFSAG